MGILYQRENGALAEKAGKICIQGKLSELKCNEVLGFFFLNSRIINFCFPFPKYHIGIVKTPWVRCASFCRPQEYC